MTVCIWICQSTDGVLGTMQFHEAAAGCMAEACCPCQRAFLRRRGGWPPKRLAAARRGERTARTIVRAVLRHCGKIPCGPRGQGLRTVTGCIPQREAHFRAVMEEQLRLERGEQIRIRRKRLDRNENDKRGNGVTEVTPHLLKTQGFRHVLILLFYDHPAERVLFSLKKRE